MWFESDDIISFDKEIEIEDVFVEFHKKNKKLEDFYRRINYRYDWIQISTDKSGNIKSILNLKELRKNWNEIKSLLQKDYEGKGI